MTRTGHVIVVGAGNAGMCAALAAWENGARVTVLERAPRDQRGGNTAYTAGAMRVPYDSGDDLLRLLPEMSETQLSKTDFGSYPEAEFFADMGRVTQYRADPDLVEALVTRSFATLEWMRDHGIQFAPMYGRQAFEVDGVFRFWGGLSVEVNGGGPGLVDGLFTIGERCGFEVLYEARALTLLHDDDGVRGVRLRQGGQTREILGDAVVLASGGFQASTEWRSRYLGPGWDLAKVRGTKYNTGDGIRMALEVGASACGNWSGCHAVGWDYNAPEFGDLKVGDGFQKHSYPFGVMVNCDGNRFVDEGADYRNYTYAKYGQEILRQPRQMAWQIFDQKVVGLLRDEYRIREVTKVSADSLEELARSLEGVDHARLLATIAEFNAAVREDVPFDPTRKDGRSTEGLDIPKSNWANPLDKPPFEAYAVTCGITFTFGGLRLSTSGEVMSEDGGPIPGLYAAGELVGGLFYFNYPGGTGLTSGAVFGRISGGSAGTFSGR